MFLWQGPYVWLTIKVHRHSPPPWSLAGVVVCCQGSPWYPLVKRQTLWLQTPGPDSCSPSASQPPCLCPSPPDCIPSMLMTRLASNTVVLGNKHLFSLLMKLPSNYAHNSELQPTFRGRAIIIILSWSRQLSAYLPFAGHALFTRLALKCFSPCHFQF